MERASNYLEGEMKNFLDNSQIVIYLLVNPRSGSQEGKVFTDLEEHQFMFKLTDEEHCQLNIVNILEDGAMDEFK